MKRLVAILLTLVLCFSLTACGGGGASHTIKYEDGTTETMSTKELLKIQETDGRTWEKIRKGTISGTGKITDIQGGYGSFVGVTTSSVNGDKVFNYRYVVLILNDNVHLLVREAVSGDFYVGDTVRFEGTVTSGYHDGFYLYVDCADTNKENTQQFVFLVK